MRRALVALVAVPVLLVAGCRDDPAGGGRPEGPATDQFDQVESTLADIESDLDGD